MRSRSKVRGWPVHFRGEALASCSWMRFHSSSERSQGFSPILKLVIEPALARIFQFPFQMPSALRELYVNLIEYSLQLPTHLPTRMYYLTEVSYCLDK